MKCLHVFPPSPNAKKAMMVNHLTGLNLPLTIVNLQEGEQQSDAFLALNPNGKIPVLELADGSSLWESNAMINRMASEAKSDLWPATMDRYDIMRWQFWEACHWTPACGKFISKHLFQREGIDMEAAEVEFHRFAKVLDDNLDGRDWLVGAGMTTADISVACILAYKEACQYPLSGYVNIARWFDSVQALDAWAVANPAPKAA
ncbi:MAG: glutathione S-transferase family protein [Paracoccaceae bacterium]